jgi:hypothetical protein
MSGCNYIGDIVGRRTMLILVTVRVPRGSVFFQIQGVNTLLMELTVTATKQQG